MLMRSGWRARQDSTSVGDEGGFAPNVLDAKEALDLVVEAIGAAGYEGKIEIGMDVAASEFHTEDGMYDLDFKSTGEEKDEKLKMTGEQLNDTYVRSAHPPLALQTAFLNHISSRP